MAEADGKHTAGAIFFAVFAVLFLGGAYAMWPADFFSTQFSDMTSGTLLRAAAAPVLAILGLEFVGAFVIVTQAER